MDREQSLILLFYLFEILPRINPRNDTQEIKGLAVVPYD